MCVHLCVCMCAKACQVSTNYLDSSLALVPSWRVIRPNVHWQPHSIDSIAQGYRNSHIYSFYGIHISPWHTQTQHTAVLRGKKNSSLKKLTLKFICISFSLTFSLVSSQSLAACHRYFLRCVHIATRSGKKCWPTFHQLGGKEWALKPCSITDRI